MTRIIITTIIAFSLVACGSEENGQEKKFNTEKKAESSHEVKQMAEVEKKIATVQKETATVVSESSKEAEKKPVTYPKNIFELTTIDGKTLHVDEAENGIVFQEHKEKVVLIIFFGYRCPPCLSEIPAIKKLVEEKGDKLEVIAMEVQRLPEEQLKIFKESKKLNYTVLSGEHTENSEFISYIAERAQWTGSIPFLVGITPKGEVGVVHVGGMGLAEFKTVFDNLSKQ